MTGPIDTIREALAGLGVSADRAAALAALTQVEQQLAERRVQRDYWIDRSDAAEARARAAEQRANELADALREIASLPSQSEHWHETDVAVRVARAALDRQDWKLAKDGVTEAGKTGSDRAALDRHTRT